MDIKALTKNISMIVGITLNGLIGLFFILFSDLYLKATSTELFLGIFLPLASIVNFILAESFRHKPNLFLLFKIAAFVVAIGFIVYLFVFMDTSTYSARTCLKLIRDLDGKKVTFLNHQFSDALDIYFDKTGIYITSIVLEIVGTIALAVNAVMNKVIGID